MNFREYPPSFERSLDVDRGGSLDQKEFCSMATTPEMRGQMMAYFLQMSAEQKAGEDFELSMKEFVQWLLRTTTSLKDLQFQELVEQMQSNVDEQVKKKTLERKRRSSVATSPMGGGGGVPPEVLIEMQNEITALRSELAEEREAARERQEQTMQAIRQELAAMSTVLQATLTSRDAERKAAMQRRRQGSSKREIKANDAGSRASGDGASGDGASGDGASGHGAVGASDVGSSGAIKNDSSAGAGASTGSPSGHDGGAEGSVSPPSLHKVSVSFSLDADEDRRQDGERTGHGRTRYG